MPFPPSLKEKYLVFSIQLISGVIFFLPFFSRSTYYFPFITPRNFAFRILVEILVFLYLLLILKNSEYFPRKNIIWMFFFGFIIALTLSSILGGDFTYSFWANYERMDGLVGYYHLFAYFFVIYCVFKDRKVWERLLQVSIFASIIIATIGLSQSAGVNLLIESSGGDRISSTLGNPTFLAAYLLIHLFLSIYFLLKKSNESDLAFYKYGFIVLDILLIILQLKFAGAHYRRGIIFLIFSNPAVWAPFLAFHILAYSQFFKRFRQEIFFSFIRIPFYSLISLIALFLISQTRTRGAVAGLILAVILSAAYLVFQKKVKWQIRLAAFLAAASVFLGVFLVFQYSESKFVKANPFLEKIASVSQLDRTTQSRVLAWQASWIGFLERPVFGWGVENFYRVFDKHFPPEIYEEEFSVVWYDRPHNALVQYAVEGGALALAFYLGFIGTLCYFLFRYLQDRRIAIIFFSLIAAYIGQNFFVFDSINSYMPFYFVAAFMIFLVEEKMPREKLIFSKASGFVKSFQEKSGLIIFSSGIFLVGFFYIVNVLPIFQVKKFVQQTLLSDKLQSKESMEGLVNFAEESVYLGRFEIVAHIAEKISSWTQHSTLPDYELAELAMRVEKMLRDTLKQHPNDIRLHLIALTFFLNTSRLDNTQLDKIIDLREKSISLSPARSQTYQITGRALMARQRYQEGLKDFQKATELAPEVLEPRFHLFAAYVTIDDLEKAKKEFDIFKKFRTFTPEFYIRGAKIYALKKYYAPAIELMLEAINSGQEPASLYAQLADLYLQAGEKNKAREAAMKAIELDPSFAEQGKEFLKNL